jgi:hypothetical protein
VEKVPLRSQRIQNSKHATAIGRAGQRDEKRGTAELERVVLHKGKALAESYEGAAGCNFVQEKMNKVKNDAPLVKERSLTRLRSGGTGLNEIR